MIVPAALSTDVDAHSDLAFQTLLRQARHEALIVLRHQLDPDERTPASILRERRLAAQAILRIPFATPTPPEPSSEPAADSAAPRDERTSSETPSAPTTAPSKTPPRRPPLVAAAAPRSPSAPERHAHDAPMSPWQHAFSAPPLVTQHNGP